MLAAFGDLFPGTSNLSRSRRHERRDAVPEDPEALVPPAPHGGITRESTRCLVSRLHIRPKMAAGDRDEIDVVGIVSDAELAPFVRTPAPSGAIGGEHTY